MQVVSIISTKGGVGKTTTAANLGGLAADAGCACCCSTSTCSPRCPPTTSWPTARPAASTSCWPSTSAPRPAGVAHRSIAGLDLVLSNDDRGELNTLAAACAGWAPAAAPPAARLAPLYDLLLIDTQGARSVLLEMAVLASDLALSPVTPEILAARELRRGTMQLIEDIAPYRHLGIEPPPLHLLINRVHPVSANARLIQQALRDLFQDHAGIRVLDTDVPAIEAYPRAATRGLPVHRVEYRQPLGRVAPAALDTMRALAGELFPQWQEQICRNVRPPATSS
jgi:chromosome partitioning related protein ParA